MTMKCHHYETCNFEISFHEKTHYEMSTMKRVTMKQGFPK